MLQHITLEINKEDLQCFYVNILGGLIINNRTLSEQDVFKKSNEKNYWTYLRKNNDWETYFIKDNNGNMFEIKKRN